jgi:hypothetical protein
MQTPFWTDKKIAHPGVKTSVGRGKPEMIPLIYEKLNAFKRLSTPCQLLVKIADKSRESTCNYRNTVQKYRLLI